MLNNDLFVRTLFTMIAIVLGAFHNDCYYDVDKLAVTCCQLYDLCICKLADASSSTLRRFFPLPNDWTIWSGVTHWMYILEHLFPFTVYCFVFFPAERDAHAGRSVSPSVTLLWSPLCATFVIDERVSETFQTHLDNIGFVSLQDLNGLSGLRVDNEDAGVASLSNQTLPAPEEKPRQKERERDIGEKISIILKNLKL